MIDKIWPTLSRAARALVVCFALAGSQLGSDAISMMFTAAQVAPINLA